MPVIFLNLLAVHIIHLGKKNRNFFFLKSQLDFHSANLQKMFVGYFEWIYIYVCIYSEFQPMFWNSRNPLSHTSSSSSCLNFRKLLTRYLMFTFKSWNIYSSYRVEQLSGILMCRIVDIIWLFEDNTSISCLTVVLKLKVNVR